MTARRLRRQMAIVLGAGSAALLTVQIAGQVAGPVAAPSPVTASGEPATAAEVELGRALFWDPVLSGSKDVACATCHHPDFAYADGRDLSRGAGAAGLGPARADQSNGRIPLLRRNAPTVINVAFNGVDRQRGRGRNARSTVPGRVDPARAPMFWDNRVRSLEAQALEPLKAREEMRGDAWSEATAVEAVVARLRDIPEYVARFEAAFGPGAAVDAPSLGRALATFQRTLVAMNSPVDRFASGEADALTPQQRRGMQAFDDVGCDRCHSGPMFSDFDLHAEGVREHPALPEPDAGAGRFRFRTPSLRNVALTAPYMHNGVLSTLADVLRFYDNGRSENPNVAAGRGGRRGDATGIGRLARDFQRVDDMSDEQMLDIIAFLEALTDTGFDRTVVARVPSGLPPGGLLEPGGGR